MPSDLPDVSLYPRAERYAVVDVLHDTPVFDPYRWLEDRRLPETERWCRDQDHHWQSVRDSLPRRQWWHAQVAAYLDFDFSSTPIWRGSTRFTLRHMRGMYRPGLYRDRPGDETRDLLGMLPDGLSSAGGLSAWQPSHEGDILALALARGGAEEASLYLMDVGSGAIIDGPAEGCGNTSLAWLPGGKSLYYVRRPATPTEEGATPVLSRRQVFLHHIGSPFVDDEVVFEGPADEERYYSLVISRDGKWLVISASDGSPASGNDLWLGELARGTQPRFTRIQNAADASSGISIGPDGLLYILTNRGAPNWRIMVTAPEQPYPENWREVIGADPNAVINDFAVLNSSGSSGRPQRLLVAWSRDAVSEVSVHDLADGSRVSEVPLPGTGRVGALVTRDDDPGIAWFSYTDFTTPPRTVEYEVESGATRVSSATDLGTEALAALTERRWCTSADGTRIQMIVVRPPGTNGPLPTILCGYGGFGTSMMPTYSASAMGWVRAGGCYVTANVRGGGERGEKWHRDGRGHHKQNAINDFLACAESLIDERLTSANQLAIWGGSNGALLISAALTQRPDLFAAAVGFAPLCDMVRYERSGLGPVWRSEYGSVADAEDFRSLLAYSPYHNVVTNRRYPATLFAVSDADERVDPAHARKMCAALQHATVSKRPIVLRRENDIGHNGRAKGSAIELTGDILAFIAAHTGLAGAATPKKSEPQES